MANPLTSTALLHAGTDAAGRPFLGDLRLRAGRVHEFCGAARVTLALMLAGDVVRAGGGEVFWIAPAWTLGAPNPDGFAHLVAPGRITFLAPRRPEDVLWCLEETLRAGTVDLVIADLPAPPALTPVRRMHLAAEAAGTAPMGVLLTPEAGGAAGVESRWSLEPDHGAKPAGRWALRRLRARWAPPAAWTLERDGGAMRLTPAAAGAAEAPVSGATRRGNEVRPSA